MIRTVTGDVETIEGRILAHEHLQIDLSAQKGPANKVGVDEEAAVVEDLRAAKAFGLAAITDLSAPRWGRDPVALKRISETAGVKVIYAAGYYWDPFPDIAVQSSVEKIRDAMVAEIDRDHRVTFLLQPLGESAFALPDIAVAVLHVQQDDDGRLFAPERRIIGRDDDPLVAGRQCLDFLRELLVLRTGLSRAPADVRRRP